MRRGDAMRRTSRKRSFSPWCITPCAFLIVLLFSFSSLAATSGKLVLSDSISRPHREELLRRLRKITGWTELTFNNDGALQANPELITGGSASARDLLNRALSGDGIIVFEDASSRKDVVFCKVISGKPDPQLAIAGQVHVVQIDFTDFRQVTGDKQALAAFDVGWAVLHEIDHVVADSEDPQQNNYPGHCENHINTMRRELGLPVRNTYFYSFLPIRNDSNLVSRYVRLGFDEESGPAAKRRRYWLIWDAAVVGGLS